MMVDGGYWERMVENDFMIIEDIGKGRCTVSGSYQLENHGFSLFILDNLKSSQVIYIFSLPFE
jgi:hypothetical protein